MVKILKNLIIEIYGGSHAMLVHFIRLMLKINGNDIFDRRSKRNVASFVGGNRFTFAVVTMLPHFYKQKATDKFS
jgi:hypothetical protein